MEVLLLAWSTRRGGVSERAAGLAVALAHGGEIVRVVTRLVEGGRPPRLMGCEVHAVPDAPPVVPDELDGDHVRALGFGASALAVVSRRLRESAADLTLALGHDTLPVAARLPTTAGAVVVDVPDRTGRPDHAAAAVVAQHREVVVAARLAAGRDPLAAMDPTGALVVPAAGRPPRRRPGPPPAAGPVRLVVGPGGDHAAAARRLRRVLADRGRRRMVTAVDTRRPAVTVVLGGADDPVLRAAALGVPVVAVGGGPARAAAALFHGVDVSDERAAAEECAALLASPDRAAALGAAGLAASARARSRGVAVLRSLVDRDAPGRPRLRAVR